MKLLRTDGGGGGYVSERLKMVKSILNYWGINKIYLLQDHKGLLTVVWEETPTDNDKLKVTEVWEIMSEYEIEHKLITYIDL